MIYIFIQNELTFKHVRINEYPLYPLNYRYPLNQKNLETKSKKFRNKNDCKLEWPIQATLFLFRS